LVRVGVLGRGVMYKDTALENELKFSHTIDSQQAVWVELNMNQSYNISSVGNYRYRPGTTHPTYGTIRSAFDPADVGGFYTGATDSDIVINAGVNDSTENPQPVYLVTQKKKINQLYSLDDCFKQNRPRSGINKLLYLGTGGQYIDGLTSGISPSVNVSRRPRYYMASRYDKFKYWTSYRTEVVDNVTEEFGIALAANTGNGNPSYYIHDAAPFVTYNTLIPANRVTIKMQTNVGELDNGPFRMGNVTNVPDPLYGENNMSTPVRWAIEALDSQNNWVQIISFTEASTRSDGNPILASDGQVELEYGLKIPSLFKDAFTFAGEIFSSSMLPDLAPYGYAYLLKASDTDMGTLYISDGSNWQTSAPQYGWYLSEVDITKNTSVLKKAVSPDYFVSGGSDVYREFQFIKGLRIVVDTMNKQNCTFDLIELSPRLMMDISSKTTQYSMTKPLADLGTTSMPTGNLIASTGKISLFDEDLAFNENNPYVGHSGSIVSGFTNTKMKFIFYDIVKNVGGYDYYIPLKTLYSEKVPQVSDTAATLDFDLRDLFYFLESEKSPELLLTNVSLSYAITVLLDSIGFSNYTFRRIVNEHELIIPFFFVGPDQNVAETLQQLAISSQSAMFFNEFNDLVVMSKRYLMPSVSERATDMILYGREESVVGGTALPNILNIASQEKKVYNGGEINYTTRYIQKSLGSIAQAPYIDEYKSYIYKPVLLWEVAGQEATKTINESAQQATGYSLSAMPLKANLVGQAPSYNAGSISDNIIDFGEGVYWLGNYGGYFYANGEVIRYDAVEYSVAGVGTVWITGNHEYQTYFSRLQFNGKMYPTGRVRIYTSIKNDAVVEHGRGMFGTEIVEHRAGIDGTTWVDDSNVRGSIQNAKEYLFNTNVELAYPVNTGLDAAGVQKVVGQNTYGSQSYALRSTRNGIIKNFMANTNITETDVNYYKTALSGSVQSSALVFNGPTLPADIDPADFVTYSYKTLDKPYKHFGTRLRIIGRVESGTNKVQSPLGAFDIYSNDITSTDPTKQISITGGSAGISFGLNKDTNVGYYYEVAALSQNNISTYKNNSAVASYTILTSPIISCTSNTVTLALSAQHDFEVGQVVIVSGVVDDNRKTSPTAMNGEYKVASISADRKYFTYSIAPTTTTASITAVSRSGSSTSWTITYIANNDYRSGQILTITGLAPAAYNITGAVVSSATPTQFTVNVASDYGVVTDGVGSAAIVALTTTASTGGTVTKVVDSNTLISDVFFYKVVSGSVEADIIKKARAGTVVTLTTLRDPQLVVGESIVVTGVDAALNGTFAITEVGGKYLKYNTVSSGTITEADLSTMGLVSSVNKVAIPKILWRGFTEIIVDDGKFTTQSRLTASEKTTVYDLSAEYIDVGSSRQFFLYLNDKQIAVVNDDSPLPQYNNVALFVRGSSRAMFENIYALSDNFAENTARGLQLPISKIFGDELITESEAIKKYALSGIVQNTYLSGISSQGSPTYSIFYDEFGTIMREAAYFNVKYDRAFPALYATLAKTINRVRGYTVSGFYAGSYGAEFLIFNAIDKNLNLDDTSGNYLRILGIAFTQNTTHSLKVDDFFKKNSNFTEESYSDTIGTPNDYLGLWTDLQNSRSKYGRNDFTIDAQYVQTDVAAEEMMDWTIKKVLYPRKTVGVITFATPHLQLGDIVTIKYADNDGVPMVAPDTTRFVVYSMDYQRSSGGASSTVYLAEV
jgi:hypothetical protein